MLAMIVSKYFARLGMLRSSADELWRSLLSCSPRSMSAPRVMLSAFESEWGTGFDAQPSLTVVYDTYKLHYDGRSWDGPDWVLNNHYSGRNVHVKT